MGASAHRLTGTGRESQTFVVGVEGKRCSFFMKTGLRKAANSVVSLNSC